MRKRRIATLVAGIAVTATAVALTVAPAECAGAKTCAFQLKIGDVLPFTGDLAAYGANLDRAVKIAVSDGRPSRRKKLPGIFPAA